MIIETTGCSCDATMVEDIMRRDVFHSTRNWHSRAYFAGALARPMRFCSTASPTVRNSTPLAARCL